MSEQSWLKPIREFDRKILLKTSTWSLFWFGVGAEIITIIAVTGQVKLYNYSPFLTPFPPSDILLNTLNSVYTLGGHFVHLVSAYWLSKGTKKGMIVAISLSLYEIVAFLIPRVDPDIFTIQGIAIRMFFVLVIMMIIFGRKELERLRYENWRPWHSPRSLKY